MAKTLEEEVLSLPTEERARLAERLLDSLDAPSEEEISELWLEEEARRAREIDEGLVELVSSDEVERKARALLK